MTEIHYDASLSVEFRDTGDGSGVITKHTRIIRGEITSLDQLSKEMQRLIDLDPISTRFIITFDRIHRTPIDLQPEEPHPNGTT